MALALKQKGASAGAVVAFLLGNPTLNPAVLVWILFTLGWQWSLLRLVAGLALVIGGAMVATRWTPTAQVAVPETAELVPLPEGSTNPALRWVRTFVRLTVTLIPLFVVLVLAMGAARAWLFPAVGADWGNNAFVILGFAVAGVLFPIPTGAEIPIIQTMMASGLGVGPAAALLLTLAPVSLPSLAMIAPALKLRTTFALAGLTVTAGLSGALIAVVTSAL